MSDGGASSALSLFSKLAEVFAPELVEGAKSLAKRRRLAVRVSRSARKSGINLHWRTLNMWLKRDDARTLVETGGATSDSAVAGLAAWMSGSTHDERFENAREVVRILLVENLRVSSPSDAVAAGVALGHHQSALLGELAREHTEEQAGRIISSITDSALDVSKQSLHPWRAARASEIQASWPDMRRLVGAVTAAADRAATLAAWAETSSAPPPGSPPEVYAWLAELAVDHDSPEVAISFLEKGISLGLSDANYWWALIALLVDHEKERDRAYALLERSLPPHPLANALRATLEERFVDVEECLAGWVPAAPSQLALRAMLLSVGLVGSNELTRAIDLLRQAIEELPDAVGLRLRAAELLLARGHHGGSDQPIEDYVAALNYALEVRDARRRWRTDSVPAILVAVKAAVLSHDMRRAWELVQAFPDGTSTPEESADSRLRREAVILCLRRGDLATARGLAGSLGDTTLRHWVAGCIAEEAGDRATALREWEEAWETAVDPGDQLGIALQIGFAGGMLPDLAALQAEHAEPVREIRALHRAMTLGDDGHKSLVAQAGDSLMLTVAAVERLQLKGEHEQAADILLASGRRRGHPMLLKSAADVLFRVGRYGEAIAAARESLTAGGTRWPGRFAAMSTLFEALEFDGQVDEARLIARDMLATAPNNLDARWVYVRCLMRAGDEGAAWTALRPQGVPVDPRSATEAKIWLLLVLRNDRTDGAIERCVGVVRRWPDDPELAPVLLIEFYAGNREPALPISERELSLVDEVRGDFVEKFPDSPVFRQFTLPEAPGELIDALGEMLAEFQHPSEVRDLAKKVQQGELPMGLLPAVLRRSYMESAIQGISGLRYSHADDLVEGGRHALSQTLSGQVTIDSTAVASLAMFSEELAHELVGSFSSLLSTDVAYLDSISAEQSLARRGSHSVRLDEESARPIIESIPDEAAEELALRASRAERLLSRAERRGWVRLRHFAGLPEGMGWLSTLDMAATHGMSFWCDDHLLRRIAQSEGVLTFGTVDLIRELVRRLELPVELAQSAEAILISNRHVDLGFDPHVMRLAAQLDAWRPHGTAGTLMRPMQWREPEAVMSFLLEAMQVRSGDDPEAVQAWVAAAAVGLSRLEPDNDDAAASNLEVLLGRCMVVDWMTPSSLPFVLTGIRSAGHGRQLRDPFERVLRSRFESVVSERGHPWATAQLMKLSEHLNEADRDLAARIALTHGL